MSIKDLRKRTGLSQSNFAEKFHIYVRTLQRWEQNQTDTPEYIIFMVQHILDLEDKVDGKSSN